MTKKRGFTLVELVVVMTIALVVIGYAANVLMRAISDRNFELAIETFYSTVYNQLLETVVSQNRAMVITVDQSFSGAYSIYSENSIDTPIMELRGLSGSYLSPNISLSLRINNNQDQTSTGWQLLKQDTFGKDVIWASFGSSGIVHPSDTGFLIVDEQKLPNKEFLITDSRGIFKSGKVSFSYYGAGQKYGDIFVNRIEGQDYRKNTILLDTLEIHFSPKGKKWFVGYKEGVSYDLKTAKIVFLNSSKSSLYIDLN